VAALGVVLLLALAWCTLVPGTPVNNDPSPAAATAGIHLTTPAAYHVAVAALELVGLALLTLVLVAGAPVVRTAVVSRRRRPESDPIQRLLLRAGVAWRRGPPRRFARA
jgi:hypothetical protein